MATQLKHSREESNTASNERQSLIKRAIGAESVVSQLREEHAAVRRGLDDARKEYQVELEGLVGTKKAYENRNQELMAQLESFRTQKVDQAGSLASVESKVVQLSEEKNVAVAARVDLELRIADLDNQLDAARRKAKAQAESLGAADALRERFTAKLATAQADLAARQEVVESLSVENGHLTAAVVDAEAKVTSLVKEVGDSASIRSELEKRATRWGEIVSVARRTEAEQVEALTSASEQRDALGSRLEAAEHDVSTMRSGMHHQQQVVAALEEELKHMVRTTNNIC